jgi:hypothetical protein
MQLELLKGNLNFEWGEINPFSPILLKCSSPNRYDKNIEKATKFVKSR